MRRLGLAVLGVALGALLVLPLVLAVLTVTRWLSAVHIDGTGWTALFG